MSEQRVQRIEEAVSFAEQRADDLDAALRDVADRLMALGRRLERIESRLSVLETPGESDGAVDEGGGAPLDRPPHSGRLPGDR